MKLHLQTTDYGSLLSSAGEDLTVSLVDSRLRENLLAEFSCLRSASMQPLSTFLDYITYVMAIITSGSLLLIRSPLADTIVATIVFLGTGTDIQHATQNSSHIDKGQEIHREKDSG